MVDILTLQDCFWHFCEYISAFTSDAGLPEAAEGFPLLQLETVAQPLPNSALHVPYVRAAF